MLFRMFHAPAPALLVALLITAVALRAIALWRREHRRVRAFRTGLRILATYDGGRPHLRLVRPRPRYGLLARMQRWLRAHALNVAAACAVLTVLGGTSVLLVAQRQPAEGAAPAPIPPTPRPAPAAPLPPVTVTVTVTPPPRAAPAGVAASLPKAAPVPPPVTITAAPATVSAPPSSTSSAPAATPRKTRPPQPSSNPQSTPSAPPSDQPTLDAAPPCQPACVSVTLAP